MMKLIENAVVVGRSWGDKNLIVVENAQNGQIETFEYTGLQEIELGAEGVLEFNDKLVISFTPALEEVLA